jgi:predicted transglutaminase-like cysteine proteinase
MTSERFCIGGRSVECPNVMFLARRLLLGLAPAALLLDGCASASGPEASARLVAAPAISASATAIAAPGAPARNAVVAEAAAAAAAPAVAVTPVLAAPSDVADPQPTLVDISMKPVGETPERPPRLQPAVFTRPLADRSSERVGAPESPSIFGSVALLAGHTPEDAKWRRVADYVPSPAVGPWSDLVAQARAMAPRERLEAVNAWVNHRIVWTADVANFGVADYWGTAQESLGRGRGDCKDYAIAKMELLRAMGVSADQLYFVVVRDLVRRADHAVLAVRLEGRFLILDSGGDAIMDSEEVRDYRPILTYSVSRTWIHGFRRAPDVILASASAAPAASAPAQP